MTDAAVADAALVAKAREGDTDAFATLVLRYHAECSRFARRMLGNRPDAEDALQDALLRAYRALTRYREQDSFRAWLFQIVANQCRAVARGRARREARFLRDDDGIAQTAATGVLMDAVDEGLRRRLDAAIGRLDPILREALLLKYGEDMKYSEMASVTGASVSALKMRVKRACDVLRPQLGALLDE